ncbi:MAG: bifunctional diaminohydroxyphosphoribosylaminopyrimidine deaminase/5-amino-6-(5-phosphoribosylamino)uracil reductase RibD, partial [Planctomycetota bacterium]|nr:bifunctional diaminohydroxyphosphoribosylaminopyrimidine deaminase/5-amino-6-(5-phosphoribosylamino)uracil reductase RibD [Planctomycetota bacterium]
EAHAEINALNNCSESSQGSTAIITLEPCCHTGKTPPCSQALIQAGVKTIIVGMLDPNPKVNGAGLEQLVNAGLKVHSNFLQPQIAAQNSGFVKLQTQQMPWVIAKYAMTLDGNIATTSGDSQWISNEQSRAKVHQLRGQVDAIVVGSRTVNKDDPRLTARPAGPRVATRIVFDSNANISLESQLVQTARDYPTLVIVHPDSAPQSKIAALTKQGIEVLSVDQDYVQRIQFVLKILGQRQMTNVLVEGGGQLLGEFFQANQVDEVRAFIAPKFIGTGIPPVQFPGIETISKGREFSIADIEHIEGNLYLRALSG